MRTALFLVSAGLAVVATTITTVGQSVNLDRGKYLVEQVSRCHESHTPQTDTGEFDKSR